MEAISKSVRKKDHDDKMGGYSLYVADYPSEGVLCGKMLRSQKARAALLGVEVPSLPEGYFYVDARDVPGDNQVHIVLDDTPVYAADTVEYIGEPIAMICGPDEETVRRLRDECRVLYGEQKPVTDFKDAKESFFEYHFGRLSRTFEGFRHLEQVEFAQGFCSIFFIYGVYRRLRVFTEKVGLGDLLTASKKTR